MEFKFVSDFDRWFEKGFGRYTFNVQVVCPFLDELNEFNSTTALLLDDVGALIPPDEEEHC